MFNSSLEGNTRRAIDTRDGEKLNEGAFKELIRTAVAGTAAVRAARPSPKLAGITVDGFVSHATGVNPIRRSRRLILTASSSSCHGWWRIAEANLLQF